MILFNKPYITGKEIDYIGEVIGSAKLSGNGAYTKKCHEWFKTGYKMRQVLLTSSCTDALEMMAILMGIKPGDEVIMPSYTFVSTANAFILRGAKIRFADSRPDHPGMDEDAIETLVTEKTRAIIPVHYAGVACDMDKISAIAQKHHLLVGEDAAQAIDSFYKGKALGSIGNLGAFSFHETKNISSGEGGMLSVNDPELSARAEIIWEKGTNRSAFYRGEVDKYNWVDVGSSFLPSEITAAFLYAQLEQCKFIQERRNHIWNLYHTGLTPIAANGHFQVPFIPDYATTNGHMYYLVCNSLDERTSLIDHLKSQGINAVFHYLSLHKSPFFEGDHDHRVLSQSDRYTDCLVRLPLYCGLQDEEVEKVINAVKTWTERARSQR